MLRRVKRLVNYDISWWRFMSSGAVRLHLSKDAMKKLFNSKKVSVSKGIDEVLDKYSEKVEEDVLIGFIKERR